MRSELERVSRPVIQTATQRSAAGALILALVMLAGCSTIHIQSEHGVETRSALGVVVVKLPETSRSLITETTGLGLVAGQGRLTLGWMSEAVVAIQDPSHCQVVFMSATVEEATAIERLFRETGHDLSRMCFLSRREK